MLLDVHFHPTDFASGRDLPQMLLNARTAGIDGAIATGYDPPSNLAVIRMAHTLSGLVAAVGYHPWFLNDSLDLDSLRGLAASPYVIAIGEIGMDGKCEVEPALQETWFRRQLALSVELQLPVIVHSRAAVEGVLRVLRDFPDARTILHSFPGSGDVARPFLAMGACFSLSGSVTRSNARKALSLLDALPLDRILLETDAPAIGLEGVPPSEVELRHILDVAEAIAQRKRVPLAQLLTQVSANADRLFGSRLTMLSQTEPPATGQEQSCDHGPADHDGRKDL